MQPKNSWTLNAVAVWLVSMLLVAGMAVNADLPSDTESAPAASDHPWYDQAQDPARSAGAVADHAQKVPAEFDDRLQYAAADGSILAMVTLTQRTALTEALAESNSLVLDWYGDAPRYMARVTPDHVATLLASDAVLFLEPDYPLTYFLSESTVSINARSLDGAGTGVWSFDADGGPMGSLVSDVPEQEIPYTGAGVTVSVVDSGIDKTHRDFGGWDCEAGPYEPCESRILASVAVDQLINTGLLVGNDLPTTEAASGHGTHVAGTVGGNGYYVRDDVPDERYGGDGMPIGVAPEANLVSVKNGDSQSAALATAALQWTLEHAAEYGIRVSTNSWGCLGGCSFNPNSATSQTVKDLFEAGVVVTFAVGNDGGSGGGGEFSGNAQNPYAVGVANYDDATDQLARSSSRGSLSDANELEDPLTWTPEGEGPNGVRRADVAAPGTSIWSARTLTGGTSSLVPRLAASDVTGGPNTGTVEYVLMSGTSMATPHVAGAAAILFDACDAATPLEVFRALFAGADASRVEKTDDFATAEPFEVGYGGLDVRASLQWLLDDAVCGGDGHDGGGGGGDDGGDDDPPTSSTVTIDAPEDGATVPDGPVTVSGKAVRVGAAPPTDGAAGGVEGGGTLWFVGDGTATTGTDPFLGATNWVLSSDGRGDALTFFDQVAGWNVQADENRFLPTFIGTETVTFSGEPVTLHAFLDDGEALRKVGPNCAKEAQMFDASGALISDAPRAVAPAAGIGFGFADPVEILFTITPVAGTYEGIKIQVGNPFLDCAGPSTWMWGEAVAPSRLELGPGDALGAEVPGDGSSSRIHVSVDGGEPSAGVDLVVDDNATVDWSLEADLTGLKGEHTLTVTWDDRDGSRVDSATVTIDVDKQGPVVWITDPADGATVPQTFTASGVTEETGASEGMENAFTLPPLGAYGKDTLDELGLAWHPELPALEDALGALDGFRGLVPVSTGDGPVAYALFAGAVPAGVQDVAPPPGWTLVPHAEATPEPLSRQVELAEPWPLGPDDGPASHDPVPPTAPYNQFISPGAQVYTFFDENFNSVSICTANFLWKDQDGDIYLGTAGHCFLDGETNADGSLDLTRATVDVCRSDCLFGGFTGAQAMFIGAPMDVVRLGHPTYARAQGVGQDFGIVKIPEALHDDIDPAMPVWGGPFQELSHDNFNGDLVLHHGNALGLGETFASKTRMGLSLADGDATMWQAIHPSAGGDSGSAISMLSPWDTLDTVRPPVISAAGLLTHGIGVFGVALPGVAFGTTMPQAAAMALEAGLCIAPIMAGQDPAAAPSPEADPELCPGGGQQGPRFTMEARLGDGDWVAVEDFDPAAGTWSVDFVEAPVGDHMLEVRLLELGEPADTHAILVHVRDIRQVEAQAVDDYDCAKDHQWLFVMTSLRSPGDAPESIEVRFADGSSEAVALDRVNGKTAQYRTASHASPGAVEGASAWVYSTWDGSFRLGSGPC